MAFEGLTEKISATFKKLRGKGRLKEADVKEAMREIRMALLEADVSYKVVKDFTKSVTERCVGTDVLESLTPAQMIVKIVNEELTRLMGSDTKHITINPNGPTVVMLVGLQGAGKTTNGSKLAGLMKRQGKNPLLVACDIYRPAAIDQLKVVGKQVETPVFEMGKENPVKIAQEAIKYAKDYGHDIVILDTAGRLHVDEELMQELQNIKSTVEPHEILLVIDSMTGQDSVNVAESFNNALGIDGVILTKLDGDTRGGAALSVRAVTGKPIKFVGMGEKLDELEPFYPDRMASRILGMGDVLSLLDKVQNEMDEEKAAKAMERLKNDQFDMNDLLDQMKQIRGMGPLGKILEMIPGVAGKVDDEAAAAGEKELATMEAIINSMTKAERANPEIINPNRKRRIAAGSGTDVSQVNRLLKQHKQMKDMMKQMKNFGKKGGKRRMPFFPGMGNLPKM